MEEVSGFERQQLFLACIPLVIFLYLGFYLLGLTLFFFVLSLWEETEDFTPEDEETEIPAFEDPEIEMDEFLVNKRINDAVKYYLNKDKCKIILFNTKFKFRNVNFVELNFFNYNIYRNRRPEIYSSWKKQMIKHMMANKTGPYYFTGPSWANSLEMKKFNDPRMYFKINKLRKLCEI